MKLRDEILKEHSRKQCDMIAEWVCTDKSHFSQLIKLLQNDTTVVAQRASWILRAVTDKRPDWIIPQLKSLMLFCRKPVHPAVKRNVTAIMQQITLPVSLRGMAATLCFDFLEDPEIPVAVKVFSMQVLYNITLQEPALRNELELLINEQMELSKPAFRSRGLKVLKQLSALQPA